LGDLYNIADKGLLEVLDPLYQWLSEGIHEAWEF
jgi:hypothetical protein